MMSAVGRSPPAALRKGEAATRVSTDPHWTAIRPRLEAEGVDVQSAQTRGQLTVVDANELLPRFMKGAMPDPPVFKGAFSDVVREARASGGYEQVRVWGEMVDVLWERGDVAGSMN